MFLLQLLDRETGELIRFEGGRPVEAEFISALANALVSHGVSLDQDFIAAAQAAILSKGVGFFKTEDHVRGDIADGLRDVLQQSQQGTLAVFAQPALEASVRDAISVVKKLARRVA